MSLKPPIQVYGVEGRYATALFSAASKQKKLDQVEQELGKVSVSMTNTLNCNTKMKRTMND